MKRLAAFALAILGTTALVPVAPAGSSCHVTYVERETPVGIESRQRTDLRAPGLAGVRLTITGRVLDERCRPLPGVLLQFWQTDAEGVYDRAGNRLHGHQYTDGRGRYSVQTIVPGTYGPRTPHIHVGFRTRGGLQGMTELYLPSTVRAYGMDVGTLNARDGWFDERNVLRLGPRRGNGYAATFDFVFARR
jgi:protocatechuate 3,4-dioxygenase beta subunit